jgi:hypothetical protein
VVLVLSAGAGGGGGVGGAGGGVGVGMVCRLYLSSSFMPREHDLRVVILQS